MDKNMIKEVIMEMFKNNELHIELDVSRDRMHENWNEDYKVNVEVRICNLDNVLSKASDYVLIDRH